MNRNKLMITMLISVIVASCAISKSAKTSSSSSASVSGTVAVPAKTERPKDGIYPPGNEELFAITMKYPEVTLDKLKEGHDIYVNGACRNCHGPMNIYNYNDEQWKGIMDDMAERAKISDSQKDAVYKYVLAINAARVK